MTADAVRRARALLGVFLGAALAGAVVCAAALLVAVADLRTGRLVLLAAAAPERVAGAALDDAAVVDAAELVAVLAAVVALSAAVLADLVAVLRLRSAISNYLCEKIGIAGLDTKSIKTMRL